METDSLPRYELYHNAGPSSHPAMVESTIPELCEGFHRISIVISLNIELVQILCKLQQLADAIVQAKSNSAYIIHSIASLRYRLLSCNRAKMASNRSDVVAEACRLGALIFMKPSSSRVFVVLTIWAHLRIKDSSRSWRWPLITPNCLLTSVRLHSLSLFCG